ncbi:MAG: DUF4127 family protein [Oscillospiraceae bacterium]
MKYIYVPVDNRPCNNLFPIQLAKLQNIDLIVPPTDIMDDFTAPSDYERLIKWLFETCSDNSVLVLSVDNLVFGSLLNSRKSTVSLEDSISRMESIKELKLAFPNMKIYAFNVLMRTSISTFSTAQIENWKLVNEYSQLVHKIELYNNKDDIKRVAQLESLIPTDILDTFLFSRKRNGSINKMSIEFVKSGIFENVSILQEDSTPYGVHKKEQSELVELVEKYKLSSKVHIHNGTDEAGCLTLAKAVVDHKKLKTKLSYLYLNDNRDTFVASYEDRLFHENLLSHSVTAGIELYDNDDAIKDVLIIYTPVDKQYEASFGDGTPPCDYSDEKLDTFAKVVFEQVEKGKRVYLLDVAYANGGQGDILRRIHKYTNVTKLFGYSAWNTASNALGTILAQIILCQDSDENQNRIFTLERLLDDFAYQGVIRKRLEYKLKSLGEDTLNLTDKKRADENLQELMENFIKTEKIFKNEDIEVISDLPWPRIFEAKVLVK